MQNYAQEREALNRLTSLIVEKLEQAKVYRTKTIEKIEKKYDPKLLDLKAGIDERKSELVDVLKTMEIKFKGYKIAQRQYFGESLNCLAENVVGSEETLDAIEKLLPTWITKHMNDLTAKQTSIVNEWTNSYYAELKKLQKKEEAHATTLRLLGERDADYCVQLILIRRNKGKILKIFETLKARIEASKIKKEIEMLHKQEKSDRESVAMSKKSVEYLKNRVDEKHESLQIFVGNYAKIKQGVEVLCDDFVSKKKGYLDLKNDLIECAVLMEQEMGEVEAMTSREFVVELVLGSPDPQIAQDVQTLKQGKNFVELFNAGAFSEFDQKPESKTVLKAIQIEGLDNTKTIR